MKEKLFRPHIVLIPLCLLLVLILTTGTARADAPIAAPPEPGVSNEYCFECHGVPDLTMTLPSGEVLYISVDETTYAVSTHGRLGYACVQCHSDIREYPHPPMQAQTLREFKLQMYELCKQCHMDKYTATLDSTHQKALAGGNINAAVCTDCHGYHDTAPPDVPRSRIPKTCEKCHSEIYNQYLNSVHGSALVGEGNPDVPTCIDCHGVHNVSGPSLESSFHLFSPQICAKCHADTTLMERYGISTEVFDTYISDFHGTTVILFEKVAPDQETNKPVCIDCHGVHNMRKVDDPESQVIKENLLDTCQKCHPDATAEFPDSWLGHYSPDPQNAPLVFFVNLFYKIVIPATIGGMLIFIAADVRHRIARRKSTQEVSK